MLLLTLIFALYHYLVSFTLICLCGHVSFVGNDLTVGKADDSCCVLLCKLGVMSYHDDQLITGDLGKQVHDLTACFSIKSTCGLVCKENFRVIDQRAGNGNSLHLTAGHLIGTLFKLISQAYLCKHLHCSLTSFLL